MACLRGGRKNMKLRQKTIKYLQYREKRHTFASLFSKHSGCSAVRLAHLLWEQGVASSNPATPTKHRSLKINKIKVILAICFYFQINYDNFQRRFLAIFSYFWYICRVYEREQYYPIFNF